MKIFLVVHEFFGDDYYTEASVITAHTTYENAVKAMNKYADDIVSGDFDEFIDKGDYEIISNSEYQITLYAKEKYNEARLTIQEVQLLD